MVTGQALDSQNDRREPEQPTEMLHEPEQETEVRKEPLYECTNPHGSHGQAVSTQDDSQEVVQPDAPIQDFLTEVPLEPKRETEVR